MTAGLALTAGVAALLAGLLRLGFLADFISQPVLKGFIIGLALTIIIGQLPKLFGIPPGHGDFFEQAWRLVMHLGETQGLTLLVGTLSLAVIIGLRRLAPASRARWWRSRAAIAAVKAFGLDVPTIGSIASGLPSLGLPDIGLADAGGLAAGGVGVVLIAFAEGLGAAKAYAARERSTPTTSWSRSAARTSPPACQRHGGQRQPLQDGGQRVRRRAHTGLRAARGALTIVALLFFTGLFEDLPGDARRRRHRRRDRAHRRGPLVDLYNTYTARLGRQFGWIARPTSSPPSPPCWGY